MPLTYPAALARCPYDPVEFLRLDPFIPVYSALTHPIEGSREARIVLGLVHVLSATLQVVPKHLQHLVGSSDLVPGLNVKEAHCGVRIALGLVRFGSRGKLIAAVVAPFITYVKAEFQSRNGKGRSRVGVSNKSGEHP